MTYLQPKKRLRIHLNVITLKLKKKDYIGLKDCLVANSIITLSEDLSSVHSIHIGCTEPSIIPVPGDLRPLASMGIHIH